MSLTRQSFWTPPPSVTAGISRLSISFLPQISTSVITALLENSLVKSFALDSK